MRVYVECEYLDDLGSRERTWLVAGYVDFAGDDVSDLRVVSATHHDSVMSGDAFTAYLGSAGGAHLDGMLVQRAMDAVDSEIINYA